MHLIKLIQQRFPQQQGKIIFVIVLLSLSALILGLGVLLFS
jgi:hypothetical protein